MVQAILRDIQSLVVQIGDFLNEFMEPAGEVGKDVVEVNDVIGSGIGVASGLWKLSTPAGKKSVPDQYKHLIQPPKNSANKRKKTKKKSVRAKNHTCPQCRAQFPSRIELSRHECSSVNSKEEALGRVEVQSPDADLPEENVCLNFEPTKSLGDEKMVGGRRVWTCDIGECGKVFVNFRSLKDHRAKCKGVKTMSARWKRSPVNGELMCGAPGMNTQVFLKKFSLEEDFLKVKACVY